MGLQTPKGQQERIYMSEKAAPLVIEQDVTQCRDHKLSNGGRGK